MAAFQNCGQALNERFDKIEDPTWTYEVVADASTYYKIIYDPHIEHPPEIGQSLSGPRLELNLKTGQAIAGRGAAQVTCAIPSATLAKLNAIFADAKICRTVPPPDTAVCMAYPRADIELSNDTEKYLLRPPMCSAERFLCDGRDAQLREIIRQMTACGGA